MSNMKCPFCQQELDYLAEDIYGNMYCPNCRDKNGFTYKASESIWQELIRTRKALEIAVDALEMIDSGKILEHSVFGHEDETKTKIAHSALEQITASEQKD